MQDATENCQYPEHVGEPLRLELNFTFPLEHLMNSLFWENNCLWLKLTSLVLFEGTSELDIIFLHRKIIGIPVLKYRYRSFFHSDYVPSLHNYSFANIYTPPSNMQGERWIMIPHSRQILYSADSLDCKKYSLLKQQHEQRMQKPLQSHRSVCGFYTMYAAFHFFEYRQEEITGVHGVFVLSFISNYMYNFKVSN